MPTKPQPGARSPHHPADIQARRALAAQLRALRRELGFTQADVADELGVTPQTVRSVEHFYTGDPHVHTVQTFARTLERAVRLRLHDLGAAKLPTHRHLPPADADAKHRTDVLHQMIDMRHRLGFTQGFLGARMGVRFAWVSEIELGTHRPQLSTYQRYARALGGRLTLQVVAAPVIDDVVIRRVMDGQEQFHALDDAEKIVLLRDYMPMTPVWATADRLKTTPQMVKKWRELVAAA